MRAAAIAFLLLLAVTVAADDRDDLTTLAAGCVDTTLSGCTITERAELASGDCTFNDGRRFDRYTVRLPAGRAVAITLRPLDPSYTNPVLYVIEPFGQPSIAPIVGGGPAATVFVKTKVTGEWIIAASTRDLFGGGRYALHIDCFNDATPGAECVEQELMCGTEASAQLSAESCRFSTNQAYNEWLVYGVEGDRLHIEMRAFEFDPLFGIYRDGELLRSSQTPTLSTAVMDHRVNETGWYSILATSRAPNQGGDYSISLGCNRSGCLFPYVLDPVPSVITAPPGQPATIALNVHSIGPFTTSLFGNDIAPVAMSNTNTITTPPATLQPQRFYARVESECGSSDTNVFTLLAESNKRRAIRH